MAILSNIDYFKKHAFSNVPFEKPNIKRLRNADLLAELPFHEQPDIIKTNQASTGYAMSYKMETDEKKT